MSKYKQAFDVIEPSEQKKQETIQKLLDGGDTALADGAKELRKEKKRFVWSRGRIAIAASLAVVLVLAAVLPFLLINNKGGIKLSPTMFNGYKVNIDNAVSVGISSASQSESANVSPSARVGMLEKDAFLSGGEAAPQIESDKNLFVTIDAQNIAKEVVFEKIAGGGEIKQSDINAQIDKVYVAEEFIYFSMTTWKIERNWNDVLYDQTNYLSSYAYESFVIHKASGKLYSLYGLLNGIGTGNTFIEEDIISIGFVNRTFYQLSIVGDNAVFTDLVPNKDIKPSAVYKDKSGILFIDNETITETNPNSNTVYISSSDYGSGRTFGFGTDGRFYRFTNENWVLPKNAEIHVFDTAQKDWVVPTFNDTVLITHSVYSGDASWSRRHYTFINKQYMHNETFEDTQDTSRAIIGTRIFTLSAGAVTMKDFDNYSETDWQLTTVAIPNGATIHSLDGVIGNVVYATGITSASTSRYIISIDKGQPVCTLVGQNVHNANIIVLKPLN